MKFLSLFLTALPLAAQQPREIPQTPPSLLDEPNASILPADSGENRLILPPGLLDEDTGVLPLALRDHPLSPLIQTAPLDVVPESAPAPAPSTPPAAAPTPPTPAPPADPDKLRLKLTPAKLAAGEQGILSLRIPNARSLQSFPQVIEATGLTIEYMGTSSQAYSLNGKMMRSMELQYRVESSEPGTHTIPAQTLSIDGKPVTTEPLEVVVNEGQPLDESIIPQAQLAVSKTEIWEGEEVAVSVSVLVHGNMQVMNQPFPVIKSDGVAVSRFDRHGRTDPTDINGQYWNAWRMPSSMVAIKSGELVFGPAEVKLDVAVPLGNAPRDPFGSFPSARRTLNVKSNTLKIRVKPLPAEGKPKDFSGLVGKFQITAVPDGQTSTPQRVELGDPVGFEISVTGTGNFGAIGAPVLENSDGLRPFKPKVSRENRSYGQEFGQKAFSQVIFPEKPGPCSVVFVLPHFEPASGKYVIAKSAPVELLVTGVAAAAGTADAASPGDTRDFAAAVKVPVPGEDLMDILPNAVEGGRWFSTTAALVPVQPWLLHGAPAALLAILLGLGTARRLRAWSLARRPPPDAPRLLPNIAHDLRREGLSRLQFYGFVSEYVRAWEFWKKAPLPSDTGLASVLSARDHWLYATNAEPAAAPVPRDEQSRTASALTSQLSA
jgi:hypothetical protein